MFSPLAGIRVVDFTTSIAGPFCTQTLAALGAEVVKIEHPERGDDARSWGPPFWNGESAAFLGVNAGKRSLALDVKDPAGLEVMLKLLDRADVFVQNMRPGLCERLGLGFDALKARNDRLVYCTIGAFGRVGPLAQQPGYDPLMQASGGIMSITGESAERPPVRCGVSVIDEGTAMWSVIGILAALRARDTGAGAQLVDTSLYETAVAWLPFQLIGYLASGKVPQPQGSGVGMIAPYEAFQARDRWVMVAAGNDRLYQSLCEVLEAPELAEDERFRTNPDRCAHRHELAAIIQERFRARDAAEWLAALERAGVPAAPVQDLSEVAVHPQTEALGLLQPVEHPAIPDLRLVATPVSVDGERVPHRGAPPALGQDTAAVLAELGYAPGEVEALEGRGVLRIG